METENIYAAGLFDGEGTVTLTRVGSGQYRAPVVSVTSTTPELISFLVSRYGGTVCVQRTYKDHHKQSWSWRASRDKAISFLIAVLPYMREPEKRRRALLIVERYKDVTKRNGKYSEADLEKKKAFEGEFFSHQRPH